MRKFSLKKIFSTLLLILFLIASTIAGFIWYQLKSLNSLDINKDNLNISNNTKIADTFNIALFGIDSRNANSNTSRSDAIMIATIDTKEKKVKLTSVMRDSLVEIPGRGLDKITHAYAYGGPELAISTLNYNFDLNITNYVTVNFFSLAKIIDALGGFEVTLTSGEASTMNKAINEINRIEKLPYGTDYVSYTGEPTILNGRQTVSYGRIRKTGNGDFERTDRQREVLSYCISKVQSLSIPKAVNLISDLLPFVNTSLVPSNILNIAKDVLTSGSLEVEQLRLPVDGSFSTGRHNSMSVIKLDKEANIKALHNFIDGSSEDMDGN